MAVKPSRWWLASLLSLVPPFMGICASREVFPGGWFVACVYAAAIVSLQYSNSLMLAWSDVWLSEINIAMQTIRDLQDELEELKSNDNC